ncbi:MAG: plastocyanin/azurin family copper-binding protein, partial [Patescibacteria group bacterium]
PDVWATPTRTSTLQPVEVAPTLVPTAGAESAAEATISINDTDYAPSSVRVPVGSTVTFVNNGQAAHWPASDLHPTHQILPGFDAKRGLSTGETYSFTFTQLGTWVCHDHLNPQLKCTVVVE